MTLKIFLKIIGFIFVIKALFMVYYFVYGTKIWVGSMMLPSWVYLVGIVFEAVFAYWAFKFAKKR